MSKIRLNPINQRFGRFIVTCEGKRNRFNQRMMTCQCDCGTIVDVNFGTLRNGTSQSCGCLLKEKLASGLRVRHGGTRRENGKRHSIREYRIWDAMKQRCLNPNNRKYHLYGGRGIKICDRWLEPNGQGFKNFLKDMGPCPSSKHTIERENGNKGYYSENCKWATYEEQNNNTSKNHFVEYNGERKTIAQWSKEYGFKNGVLLYRLKYWPLDRAFTASVQKR